ncbi:hybrid sensor histidine kinase/response regulator transcription factor [Polaribacter sp. Q13]|uniref:hybrid sensor histidine kinase/response regulator transcription factor n=1 Tax=Polaribacter sp. Q13 TaxID=2806551 RepID=UPI00193C2EDE|nr:hybrid sensor histidine kinase/response regulator transcription factor [Polaribacter sp. Q13]QVY66918.1 response regulator [Polaribacter sp. Q13]
MHSNIFFIKKIILILLLGVYQTTISQNSFYFDHISTDKGLSQGDVNSIYQDPKGFMWFATHDGLNKYNGYEFTIYKPDANLKNSIGSNLIYAVTGDEKGNLWIGTTGSGLNYYNKSTGGFTHFIHDENNKNSITNNHVISIYKDKKDQLWVGTADGLDLVDLKQPLDSLKFKHYKLGDNKISNSLATNKIYSIFEDSQDQIWIGSTKGLFKRTRAKNGEFYFRSVNNRINLVNSPVNCIAEDSKGNLFIGTGNGLHVFKANFNKNKVYKLQNGFFNGLKVDKNDNLWAGTNNGLLYFENKKNTKDISLTKRFVYDPKDTKSISKNIVKTIYIDNTGILWIGTNGGGVNKMDPERKQFKHIKKTLDTKSLSYDKIRSIFEDSSNNLWIGTEGGGLNILFKENDNGSYANFTNLQKIKKPFAIAEITHRNSLFVGAEDTPGLYEIDLDNLKNIQESDIKPIPEISYSVFSILEDSNKNIWIGTYSGGVHRWLLNKKTGAYTKDVLSYRSTNNTGLSSNIIRNIYEDSDHNIWFATSNGLCKLKPTEIEKNNPKFEVYKNDPKDKNSISHNYILALYESKKGDLWVGTFGGGLNKMETNEKDNTVTFKTYTERDGLPNNVIKAILEDAENNLWISTNKGLSKFNPENNTFKNYDVNDGLQDNEFQELASLKRRDGEMLFGGINGFNAFYPEDIKDNPYKAKSVITSFSISNKPIKRGEEINGHIILKEPINETSEINLKYDENSFSFEFAAIHYSAPNKNKFAYKLEGFDKDWVYTNATKRFATYTNMAPGDYTLLLKASNNDGIWENSETKLHINITPPFWKTTLAYFLYFFLILAIFFGFWRNTVTKARKKHDLELANLEKQKEEELQHIKLEFFTNISHELRTPITLIKGPLEYLQKKGAAVKPEVAQEQFGLMRKNANYLLSLVNQLLDFRKINQGKMRLVMRNSNISAFIKEVAEPFQFLSHKKHIKLSFNTTDPLLKSWFDHEALEKTINNLLSNAFKFTPKNGTIDVNITNEKVANGIVNKEYIIIEVKDSGIGIPSNKLEAIFERFNTKKDANKNNNPEGIGIGLSFTKSLIELHQGTIKVSSEPGQGALFTVKIPANKEEYENLPEISCKESTDLDYVRRSSENESFAIDLDDETTDESISKDRSKSPVLLVVDDNKDIRTFIKQALGDDYTIFEAENGQEGFEIAKKITPNIIVTDLAMPIMDGLQLCKKIKTTKTTSHIPVLILTAKLSQESELEGVKLGADDYIRKPFDIELLNLKLKNILQQRKNLRVRFNQEITLQPKEVTVTSSDERFLQQAIEIVEKHMMNTDFSVEMLVKEMGHSRSNLYLKFKEITGLSSSEFIRSIRLKRAVQLFESTDLSVKEIMYMTGFNTASYFAKCFKKQFGVKPSDYVRKPIKKA